MNFYFRETKEGTGVVVETRPGVSEENSELAETIVFSIFAAFSRVCELFAQQMGFGFDDEFKDIADRIKYITGEERNLVALDVSSGVVRNQPQYGVIEMVF